MPNININKAAQVVQKNLPENPAKARRIIEEMNKLAQEKEERPDAIKKQFVILVSDPDGRMPRYDFVGWVLQIPESESPATTEDRILRAAYNFNTTKKGRLLPVKTIGEAIENATAKCFKEEDVFVKTKTPVIILKTDNVLPKDEGSSVTIKSKAATIRVDRKGITTLTKEIDPP